MTCKNCAASFTSDFCPDCGQKADIHRITISHVAHDVLHAFTHADKGFLLLIKRLITYPGIVAEEFIGGKRKSYFNPLSFLVISSAILAYVGYETGYLEAMTAGSNRGGNPTSPIWKEATVIARNSGKWLSLFFIAPLFAFLSWIFFIRKKYNYAENLVLNAFIFGEAALFKTLIIIPLFLLMPQYGRYIELYFYEAIFMIFIVVAFRQFFKQNIFLIIFKSILIRILFIVLFWVMIVGYVYLKHSIFG